MECGGDPMKLLRSQRGEMMITICVVLTVCMAVVAFALHVSPVIMHKQKLDIYANELCRVAEISGRIGDETAAKEEKLSHELGISPDVTWNITGNVQLNETISVSCALTDDVGLWGWFGSFPVTVRGKATGQSEVYWK